MVLTELEHVVLERMDAQLLPDLAVPHEAGSINNISSKDADLASICSTKDTNKWSRHSDKTETKRHMSV